MEILHIVQCKRLFSSCHKFYISAADVQDKLALETGACTISALLIFLRCHITDLENVYIVNYLFAFVNFLTNV